MGETTMSSNSAALLLAFLLGPATGSATVDDRDPRQDAVDAASPRNWTGARPGADMPPIREVTLEGRSEHGDRSGRAVLILGCREDARTGWVAIRIPDDGLGFPIDAFEGPGGVGQRRKLGRLTGLDGPGSRYLVGTFQQAAFQFDWSPTRSELRGWLRAAGKPVRLTVAAPSGKHASLSAGFILPGDVSALSETLAPCVKR